MKWKQVIAVAKTEGRKSPRNKEKVTAIGPDKRWGHTCNAVDYGRQFYVFGGYGKDDCQTDEVHVFDTAKETWSKPVVKGTAPSPRDSHTGTTVGNKIFIFGGTDGQKPLDDLFVLDTVSNTWSKPAVHGEKPPAREGHSAAVVGYDLFVFGGCGRKSDDSEVYFNDLYMLNTETFVWRKAATTGHFPVPRDSHTSAAYRNKFFVLGGTDASNSCLGDVHVLDVDTLSWKELKTAGSKVMPRAGHATVAFGRHLIVFGGFADEHTLFDDLYVLDLESGSWTRAETTGSAPSSRFSLGGDCVNLEKGIMLFYGGCNENLEALDDMYHLETDLKLDRNPVDQTPEKFSFRKELKRRRQEHLALTLLGNEKGMEIVQKEIVCTPSRAPLVMEIPQKAIGSTPLAGPLLAPLPEKKGNMGSNTFNQELKEKIKMVPKLPITPSPENDVGRSPFLDIKPVPERIFEAKINDVFHYGYTIETSIEGKPLRGLLFSYKPEFVNAAHLYLTRKKFATDMAGAKSQDTRDENSHYAEHAITQVCFPPSTENRVLSLEQDHSKQPEVILHEQHQQ